MKRFLLLWALSQFISFCGTGQVITIGPSIMKTNPGTTIAIGDLVLQASDTFLLTDNVIRNSSLPDTVSGRAGTAEKYTFAVPVVYSGTASFLYTPATLNDNTAASLAIAYESIPAAAYTFSSAANTA